MARICAERRSKCARPRSRAFYVVPMLALPSIDTSKPPARASTGTPARSAVKASYQSGSAPHMAQAAQIIGSRSKMRPRRRRSAGPRKSGKRAERGSVESRQPRRVSTLVRLPWRHAPLCAPATLGHTGDDGATNRIGIAVVADTAGVTGPALSPHISTRSRGCYRGIRAQNFRWEGPQNAGHHSNRSS